MAYTSWRRLGLGALYSRIIRLVVVMVSTVCTVNQASFPFEAPLLMRVATINTPLLLSNCPFYFE